MATADTVPLGPPHAPLAPSTTAFNEVLPDIKTSLIQLRAKQAKHEPEFFNTVSPLTDAQLTDFDSKSLVEVRVGKSGYGLHLFGKVRLPDAGHAEGRYYIHVRIFVGGDVREEGEREGERKVRLHCIHLQETDVDDGEGGKSFKAIFTKADPLEWFDT